ncbi:LLM class flavin-dependent oxidoreductase [Kitasatospora sp. NBC_01287]|uniref:LLM class flavin-dependent oxidoreductase n=1 Tax=Kitasatospora sp. NBC_01287 TaxID=2903573 RepID=UPI002257241B|nr:LLM class flavin-dependent oxidoreductase [Kitasatospora sp. NBC_01287]MCX4749328.1 LLM class flavin-dependent oxidoreductase [Kitasatospora sp. NBC_01287]
MTDPFPPAPLRLFNFLVPGPDVAQVGTWPPEGDLPTVHHMVRTAREAEAAGFHGMLVPTAYGNYVDNWVAATMVLARTARIGMLVAIRPNQLHPAQFAKVSASMAELTGGRLSVNVVLGGYDAEDAILGMVESAEQRLLRAREWLTVATQAWEGSGLGQNYSFSGKVYDVAGLRIYPPVERRPEIFLSGMSDDALRVSGMFADTHVLWADTPERTAETIARVRELTSLDGRQVRIALRLHVIVRETEEEAWRAAEFTAARIDPQVARTRIEETAGGSAPGRGRQSRLAEGSDRIGRHLWTGTGSARFGASVSVVGDAAQVTGQLMEYRRLGVDDLIVSGYPKDVEARRFGQLVTRQLADADLEFRRGAAASG